MLKMTVVFASSAGSEHALFYLKGQFQNLTTCQVRSRSSLMTQVGHACVHAHVYLSKRLDEPSSLAPFASLYLHPVASYWRITCCDLLWPHVTFRCPVGIGVGILTLSFSTKKIVSECISKKACLRQGAPMVFTRNWSALPRYLPQSQKCERFFSVLETCIVFSL